MPVIVDAHRHFYDLQRFRYPFLEYPDFAALAKTYVLRDFAADAASVRLVGSVHVQAEVDHDVDPVLETAWLQSLADADDPGLPSVCVAYADLRRSDLDDVLERHCQYPIVRGIRQELWFDARSNRADIPRVNLLDDANWRRGYRRLAAYGLSFDLLVWPWQLADAAMFFAQAPNVPVILNHMGCPVHRGEDGLRLWVDGLRALAVVEQAYVKISAMSLIDPGWTITDVRPFILRVIDIFGVHRCMFGSNFPVERLASSYQRLWAAYEEVVSSFSAEERARLFCDTAVAAYRMQGRLRQAAPC